MKFHIKTFIPYLNKMHENTWLAFIEHAREPLVSVYVSVVSDNQFIPYVSG